MAFDPDMFLAKDKMPTLGGEQSAEMDPMMRRMMLMRALGGGQNAPMPQGSPMGAAMAGFGKGMQMGNPMGGGFQPPAMDGKRADKLGGLFGWIKQQIG